MSRKQSQILTKLLRNTSNNDVKRVDTEWKEAGQSYLNRDAEFTLPSSETHTNASRKYFRVLITHTKVAQKYYLLLFYL